MAPITTIVHFEVTDENIGKFLSVWQKTREQMVLQPGIVDGASTGASTRMSPSSS